MQLQRLQKGTLPARFRVPEHGKRQTPLYDAHIMPKDLLTITVNTSDPDAAIPFNLTVATPITANNKNLTNQPSLQQYP